MMSKDIHGKAAPLLLSIGNISKENLCLGNIHYKIRHKEGESYEV